MRASTPATARTGPRRTHGHHRDRNRARGAGSVRGRAHRTGRRGLRRGPPGPQRHDRPPAGGHRPLRLARRRPGRHRARATARRPPRRARGRPQRPRVRGLRRRHRARPLRHQRCGRRWRAGYGPGRRWSAPTRRERGHAGGRRGHAARHPGHHGRRRAHAGRRRRAPVPVARPDHRQPRGRRRRARRWVHGPGQRRRAPRPLLGHPRRRRQLRRGHVVRAADPSRRHRHRGPDVLGARGHGRGPAALPRLPAGRAARAERVLRLRHRPAGAGLPRGPARPPRRRRGVVLRLGQRARRGRGDGPDARGGHAAPARRGADAVRGPPGVLRPPVPEGAAGVLARATS